MTVLWDGITIHSAAEVNDILARYKDIHVETFPPVAAPELDPVDAVRFYVKYDALANFTPHTMHELRKSVENEFAALAKRQNLLFSFLGKSKLVLELQRNWMAIWSSADKRKVTAGETFSAPVVNTCMPRK